MYKYSILSSVLVSSLLFSCSSSSSNSASEEAIKEIPVTTLSQKDTLLSVQYVTDIQALKNVEIHSRIAGTLEHVYVKEGQVVTKNQLLFKISDSELQIELNRARAAYNSSLADAKVAQVEVSRVQVLVDKKVISSSELELVTAKYNALLAKSEQALAEKNAVQQRISYTEIRAPFEGIIDRLLLREGSLLTVGSLITTVSDLSKMNAYFNVSEKIYYDMMQNGGEDEVEHITLILPNGNAYEHTGVIVPAESEIDEQTGSIAYKVQFPNPNNLLRHGATGKLILDQPVKNAVLVPQKAVLEIQDKYYVFVVDAQNMVKMQNFVPNGRIANYFLVASGLNGKETIVYEGVKSIRDGQTIQPKPITLK